MSQQSTTRFRKGFTLLEVIVALGVFSIVMAAVAEVSTRAMSTYTVARGTQRDVEKLQEAMNVMAKVLRTSTIADSGSDFLKIYSYSQNNCVEYLLTGGAIEVMNAALPTAGSPLTCKAATFDTATASNLASDGMTGAFSVTPSVAPDFNPDGTVKIQGRVGKVTILLIKSGATDKSRLSHFEQTSVQSTVSLRDYSFTGINL